MQIKLIPPMLLVGSLVVGGAVMGCEFIRPTSTNYGYEIEDGLCSNYTDDDYDGLIDCEDPDCVYTSSFCGQNNPEAQAGDNAEDSFFLCTDGIDNDLSGQFDCGDPSCRAIPEVCCALEFDNESCSDGIDNDKNGFADCGDFGCRNGLFVTVCEQNNVPRCEEFGVEYCADDENTFELCTDEIDNDNSWDGAFDCQDADCQPCGNKPNCTDPQDLKKIMAYCANRAETSLAKCTDGIDNDGNGFTDCEDFSCSGDDASADAAEFCGQLAEEGLEECTDGIDNDGDTFFDCADFSCNDNDKFPEVIELCNEQLENSAEECSDGIDNDNNGFVDCADFGCSNSDEEAVQALCQESLRTRDKAGKTALSPNDKCSDGYDNDRDGFVDCDDWDCSWNPEVTICQPPGERVCE